MAATAQNAPVDAGSLPELAFGVEGAEALRYAAVPTLRLALRIDSRGGLAIRSLLLDTQVQIAARRRGYDEDAEQRLAELFGTPDRWGTTLRTLPWLRTTVVVPPFEGATTVDLDLPCTYDLEVTASRYFDALGDGEVPLELLFSGSVFYAGADGRLQTTRLAWSQEADYALPVAVWRRTMDQHFPDSAWLRLGRQSFDRLSLYRARRGLGSWEEALDSLLGERER